jgi:hypothetical protein
MTIAAHAKSKKPAALIAYALAWTLIQLGPCAANSDPMENFTRSIVSVYTSAQKCQDTVYPGPKEYIQLISEYVNQLYPTGANYWVLPDIREHVENKKSCVNMLQYSLLQYQIARRDFSEAFPDQPEPPLLLAYRWPDSPEVVTPPSMHPAVKSVAPSSRIQ